MKRIGLIIAMQSELEMVVPKLSGPIRDSSDGFDKFIGQIGDAEIITCLSGIGKVNAAYIATMLITKYHPDIVISTGVAGSLDVKVKPSDIVIGNRVKYNDVWCGKPNAKGQIQGLPEWFPTAEVKTDSFSFCKVTRKYHTKKSLFCIHNAPIVSGDAFMETVADKMKCLRASGYAKAVDMESGAIAQICYLLKVPFLPIRVISDIVGSKGHQQNYDEFWKSLASRSFDVSMQIIKEYAVRQKKRIKNE